MTSFKGHVHVRTLFIAILLLTGASLPTGAVDDAQKGAASLPAPQQVIDYLKQTIDWHHHLAVEEQLATDPSDVLFLDNNQQVAKQALQLSFDFARAYAPLAPAQPVQGTGPGPSKYQALFREAASTDANVRQLQVEIADAKAKLRTAGGANRKKLQSTLAATQSELDLRLVVEERLGRAGVRVCRTRARTLRPRICTAWHARGTRAGHRPRDCRPICAPRAGASSSGNLLTQIEELQRSIPELEADNTKASANPRPASTSAAQGTPRRSQPSGILGLVEDLLALKQKIHALDRTIELTEALSRSSQQMRDPFMAKISA